MPRIRRRGLGLLLVLLVANMALVIKARSPYAAAGLAVLVPLLLAEASGRGERIARAILVVATAPLPRNARRTWRQDLLASLDDPDGRGPIDFALDTATAMPVIVYREWLAARPGVVLFADETNADPSRPALAGVLAFGICLGLFALVEVSTLSVVLAGATSLGFASFFMISRPEPALERLRTFVAVVPLGGSFAVLAFDAPFVSGALVAMTAAGAAAVGRRAGVPGAAAAAVVALPVTFTALGTALPRDMGLVVSMVSLGLAYSVASAAGAGEVLALADRIVVAACWSATAAAIGFAFGEPAAAGVAAVAFALVPAVLPAKLFRCVAPPDAYSLACRSRAAGDAEAATAAWRRAARHDPRRALAATYWLGITLHESADVAGARAAYEDVVRSGSLPWSANAWLNLGHIYARSNVAAAERAYRAAYDSGEPFSTPYAALSLARLHRDRGDVVEARRLYDVAATAAATAEAATAERAALRPRGRR